MPAVRDRDVDDRQHANVQRGGGKVAQMPQRDPGPVAGEEHANPLTELEEVPVRNLYILFTLHMMGTMLRAKSLPRCAVSSPACWGTQCRGRHFPRVMDPHFHPSCLHGGNDHAERLRDPYRHYNVGHLEPTDFLQFCPISHPLQNHNSARISPSCTYVLSSPICLERPDVFADTPIVR